MRRNALHTSLESHDVAVDMVAAGARVGENPWGEGATTLEWKVASPPPFHTFEELPVIEPAKHH